MSNLSDLARTRGLPATIDKNLPKSIRRLVLGDAAKNDVQRCDAVSELTFGNSVASLTTEVARLVYLADHWCVWHTAYARRFYLPALIGNLLVIHEYQRYWQYLLCSTTFQYTLITARKLHLCKWQRQGFQCMYCQGILTLRTL